MYGKDPVELSGTLPESMEVGKTADTWIWPLTTKAAVYVSVLTLDDCFIIHIIIYCYWYTVQCVQDLQLNHLCTGISELDLISLRRAFAECCITSFIYSLLTYICFIYCMWASVNLFHLARPSSILALNQMTSIALCISSPFFKVMLFNDIDILGGGMDSKRTSVVV